MDPSTDANVSANFYDLSGAATGPINTVISPNLSTTIDQRSTGGLPSGSPSTYQGSVVLSSNTQLATVVNEYGGTSSLGSNFRFDSYSGVASSNASTTIVIPQLLKNQFDPGTNTTYNSLISVQNTVSASATVTVTFYGYPSGTYSRSFTIPGNSSAFLDLQTETSLASVSSFYGSGIMVSDQPIAAVINQNGAGVLASYLGYNPSIDAAQTLYLPQILKNHYDPGTGLYYNTSILIMSVDGSTANYTITYYNYVDKKTYVSSGQANPSGGKDQRYDTALANVSWFYGTAVVTADRPVIVVAPYLTNYSSYRGNRQVFYRAFTLNTGGSTMFVPELLKNGLDSGSGISWSTGLIGQFMGSSAQTVTLTYYYADGSTTTSTASVSPSQPMFGWDQRTDPNMTQSVSAAVITCPEPFGIIVQLFGDSSALGDAAGVYSGIK